MLAGCVAVALAWMPEHPAREFVFLYNYTTDQAPVATFFDMDGQKVKCYAKTERFGGTARYPRSLEFAGTKGEINRVVDAAISDINIDTTTPQGVRIRMTPKQLTIGYRMPVRPHQFSVLEMTVYHDGRILSQEEVQQFLQQGAITVGSFPKTDRQGFRDPPAVPIDEDALERRRRELRIPASYESLPRTMYYRPSAKATRTALKQRLEESLDMDAYVLLGRLDEGKCAIDGRPYHASVYATCLPKQSGAAKDRCELLSIRLGDDLCGHVVKLGCSRLCRVEQLAQAVFEQLETEYVVCSTG